MKNKLFLLIFTISCFFTVMGQTLSNQCDLRVGIGASNLGTGDLPTMNYENEFNYKLNQYFTSAASINLGRSSFERSQTASFTQLNANIFLSPFKNNRRFDFRLGTGITFYNISNAYNAAVYANNQDYSIEKYNAFGFNMIIENTFSLKERLLMGFKLFAQPYTNGDINTGLMLKTGLRI